MRAFIPILFLEDNLRDRELATEALADEGLLCEFTYAQTQVEFEQALARGKFDLILSDFTLPSFDGAKALALAHQARPEVPFVFVSGTIGEERAVQSLRSGATDYLLKGHLERLAPMVRRVLREARSQCQQRLAEEAMRTSEHKYRHLFESLSDAAFLICEETGKIIDTNAQAEALLDRARGEILGWVQEQLYPPQEANSPVVQPVTCASQTPGGCEAMVLRKDGTGVPVHVSASRLELYGSPFLLALFHDLTERRQLERQFLRAQRLESIGTLASGVSHDLNNILTPILLAGPILSQEVKSSTGRKLLATVEICARRGADVVQQLTAFAKGLEGEKGPLQPHHPLREMCKIIAETFPKTIRLKFHVPSSLWTIVGVPTQIHQVLLNLAINARDAMPQGGRLDLSAANVHLKEAAARRMPGAKAGPYVVFRIADTGAGIAPEIADRIFDPFFSTKGPEKGTGLGLSTVMWIVKSHGGFIQFTSRLGHGTQFSVYLPARLNEAAAPRDAAPQALPLGRGELILIVDDEKDLCSVTRRTLETHGYRTLTACNGAEALALYRNRGPEVRLVITDLDMPLLGGQAAAAALRSMNPEVKIVVATGLDVPPGGGTALPADCRAVLKKPYGVDRLLQTLDQVLHGKQQRLENVL
jgi:PAS domain S-box-containing protein